MSFYLERLALFQGTTSAKCWWSTPGRSCAEPSSTSGYPTFQLGVGHSFNIFSSKNECHLCELHCEGKGQGERKVGLSSSPGLAGLSIISTILIFTNAFSRDYKFSKLEQDTAKDFNGAHLLRCNCLPNLSFTPQTILGQLSP